MILHWCRRANTAVEDFVETHELRAGDSLLNVTDMSTREFCDIEAALEARGLELLDDPVDEDAFLVGEVGT